MNLLSSEMKRPHNTARGKAEGNRPQPSKRRISYSALHDRKMAESIRKGVTFHRRSAVRRRPTDDTASINRNVVCREIKLSNKEITHGLFYSVKDLGETVAWKRPVRTLKRYIQGMNTAEFFLVGRKKLINDADKKSRRKKEPKHDESFYWNPAVRFASKHRRLITSMCVLIIVGIVLTSGVLSVLEMYTSKTTFITDEQAAGNITITDRLTTNSEMSKKVAYYLLVGVDDSQKLTDCIWIMCYDIEKSKINVMQVPRDTYVGDESLNGKFNAIYGNPKKVKYCEKCDLTPEKDEIEDGIHTVCNTEVTTVKESNISATIRAVNEHFGLPIDHFVIFNFRGFARIVDTMGGVDITLERGIHDSTITLAAGDHHLDGWDAVNYMRHRKSYIQGDVARVSAQRILINALMQKALDMDLTTMLSVLTKCVGCFQTDMSLQDMTALATMARSVKVENLEMFTMPGHDVWKKPDPSYYVCDEYETAELINEKLLPYGLPDGSECSDETVNFPTLYGKKTTAKSKSTESSTESTSSSKTTTQKTATSSTSKTTTTTTTTTTTKTTTTTTAATTTTAPTTAATAAPPPEQTNDAQAPNTFLSEQGRRPRKR